MVCFKKRNGIIFALTEKPVFRLALLKSPIFESENRGLHIFCRYAQPENQKLCTHQNILPTSSGKNIPLYPCSTPVTDKCPSDILIVHTCQRVSLTSRLINGELL